jgi:hypothetical protein
MRPQSDFAGVAELACSGQVWTCRSSLQRRRQTWISNVAPVATSAMPVEEPQRRHDHVCTAIAAGLGKRENLYGNAAGIRDRGRAPPPFLIGDLSIQRSKSLPKKKGETLPVTSGTARQHSSGCRSSGCSIQANEPTASPPHTGLRRRCDPKSRIGLPTR